MEPGQPRSPQADSTTVARRKQRRSERLRRAEREWPSRVPSRTLSVLQAGNHDRGRYYSSWPGEEFGEVASMTHPALFITATFRNGKRVFKSTFIHKGRGLSEFGKSPRLPPCRLHFIPARSTAGHGTHRIARYLSLDLLVFSSYYRHTPEKNCR